MPSQPENILKEFKLRESASKCLQNKINIENNTQCDPIFNPSNLVCHSNLIEGENIDATILPLELNIHFSEIQDVEVHLSKA